MAASSGKKRPRLTLAVDNSLHAEESNRKPAAAITADAWWRNIVPATLPTSLGVVPTHVDVNADVIGLAKEDTPRTKFNSVFGRPLATTPSGLSPAKRSRKGSIDDAGSWRGGARGGETRDSPVFDTIRSSRHHTASNPFSSKNAPAFRYAVVHTKGTRSRNEDRFTVVANLLGARQNTLYGVFDGHGGHSAAEFAAQHLADYVESAWDDENIAACVKKAFEDADTAFLASLPDGETVVAGSPSCDNTTVTSSLSHTTSSQTSKAIVASPSREACISKGDLAEDTLQASNSPPRKRVNPFASSSLESRPLLSSPPLSSPALFSPALSSPVLPSPPPSSPTLSPPVLPSPLLFPQTAALRTVKPSGDSLDGTTVLTVITLGERAVVAHAGDSRALLVKEDGTFHQLTSDHVATSTKERARVEAAGGFIDDDGRVCGLLETTRGLGDKSLKRCGVVAEPEVTCVDLTPQDAVIVLATDGLWKSLPNSAVADIVLTTTIDRHAYKFQDSARQESPTTNTSTSAHGSQKIPTPSSSSRLSIAEPRTIAERLIAAAQLKGATDNATVLIVDLTRPSGAITPANSTTQAF